MKKLLFLIVSMVVVGGVSAQSTKAITSVPSEATPVSVPQKVEGKTAAVELPSYFNHSMMENIPVFSTKPQKANYKPYGYIASTEYALNFVGPLGTYWIYEGQKNPNTGVIPLFPDSLAVMYHEYRDDPSQNWRNTCFPSTGFVFDPYSLAYDYNLELSLFQDTVTGNIQGYRIDTLFIWGGYKMGVHDPLNPDKVRVYLSSYNPYKAPSYTQEDPNNGVEYFRLWYENLKSYLVDPVIEFDDRDNIAEKGPFTKPAAASTTMVEYTLSPADSCLTEPGYITWKNINLEVNYEVPVGHVVSVVIQFIPGYDYSNGDTILKTSGLASTKVTDMEELYKNSFYVPVIADGEWENFLDMGTGFNTRLMENMAVRYDSDSNTSKNAPWNPNKFQVYLAHYYYAIWYLPMHVSISDEEIPPRPAVNEPSAIVSRIYPNPANNQVKIELINDGTAELSILNMLGQTVQIATLNDMTNTVDVSSLNAGVYMLKVSQGGSVFTTKFTKK